MFNAKKILSSFFGGTQSDAVQSSLSRKLRLENLENRELLSASTLAELATLETLAAAPSYEAALDFDAPIDLSNAVGDSLVVTSTADDGSVGTLRYAVANATAGATITFDASLSNQTIALAQGEIAINKSITIDASALTQAVTIDANDASRIFYVSGANTVELKGLALTGGSADQGGAIYAKSATLTISDSFLFENAATVGGAIYQYSGTVNLNSVSVNANSASGQGGAYFKANGVANFDGVVFNGNEASSSAGAFYQYKGTFNAVDSTFDSNVAGKSGGAFYVERGTATFASSSFNANEAANYGGAVYLGADVSLSVSGGLFTDNVAGKTGGAVFAYDADVVLSTIDDNGASFDGNEALSGHGGAIALSEGATLDASDASFYSNVAKGKGGAVYGVKSTIALDGGAAETNASQVGGAIYALQTPTTVKDATFSGNASTGAGGAISLSGATLTLVGGAFVQNTAATFGGAVYNYNGTVAQTGSTEFTGNVANDGAAVAISAATGTSIFEDAIFSGNVASNNGGAFYAQRADFSTTNVAFDGNAATNGGAIYDRESVATIENGIFLSNVATKYGAGVYLYNSSASATNALFVDNEALDGAAISSSASNYALYNATIAGNTGASALRSTNSTGALYNSIVASNSASDVKGSVAAYNTLSSFTAWSDGTNNYAYDSTLPLFTDAENGDYTLADDSQAIDIGDNQYATWDFDLAGEARIVNEVVDAGAYENQTLPLSLVVTTTVDDADAVGSLRYIVERASSGDAITFSSDLDGQTIALNGTSISFAKDLTIDASSLENGVTIDCGGQSRAFTITADASAETTSATLSGLTIVNGVANGSTSADKYGGAVYSYGVDLVLDGVFAANCSAAQLGGAVYSQLGTTTIANSSFTANTATRGAALYLHTSETTISGTSVSENVGSAAGAVFGMQCSISATDSVFEGNSTTSTSELMSGGAVGLFSNYGQVPHMPANGTFVNCAFVDNSTTKNGGAISTNAGMTLTVEGCYFSGNSATNAGGAISLEGSELAISDSIFVDNSTDGKGGAIYTSTALLTVKDPDTGVNSRVYPEPVVTIANSLLADNSANQGGAASFSGPTTFSFYNATIAGNATTASESATIESTLGQGYFYNAIVAANTGANVVATGSLFGANTLSSGVLWTNVDGTNYEYDATEPLFTDAANGDYTLAPGSQAIDLGDNQYVAWDFDLAGEARVVNDVVDLGSYESQVPPLSLVVTTTVDDAETAGSLRYVVERAEPGDTITFAAELDGQTITLGGTAISFAKTLTIDATALENGVTIDCGDQSRAFTVGAFDGDEIATATFKGLTIVNGFANGTGSGDKNGGAIYARGANLTIEGCAISDCEGSSLGGGVFVQEGVATIVDTTLTQNTATRGAAIYFHTAPGVMLNVVVDDNYGTVCSAVMAMQCSISATDCVFTNNSNDATSEFMSGGAISLFSNYGQLPHKPANGTFTNCLFQGNSTSAKNGGAISTNAGMTLTVTNCDFIENSACLGGGAISLEGSTLNVTGSRFVGNSLTSGEGAGGAIFTSTALLTVKNPDTGVSEKIYPEPIVTISNSLFAENSANKGGACYFSGPTTFTIVNSTFAKNTTISNDSATIQSVLGTGEIYNSIIALNNGGGLSTTGSVSGSHNLAVGAGIGGGVVYNYDSTQPLFTDEENGDYSLAADSQAIDKGDSQYATWEADIDGNDRISGASVDLGAYEYQTESDALLDEAFAELFEEFFD